jgi:hypothetical protein
LIDSELLKTLSQDNIAAAVRRWKGADDAVRSAILRGAQAAVAGREPDAEILVAVRRAVEEGPPAVVEIACLVAKALIARDLAAFSLVRDLVASRTSRGRIGALRCLPSSTPDELTRPILDTLLIDRSMKVREMAVDWITRNDLKQHLPLLEALLNEKNDSSFTHFLTREISLLKLGYFVVREPGSVYLTTQAVGVRHGRFVDPTLAQGLSDQEIATNLR